MWYRGRRDKVVQITAGCRVSLKISDELIMPSHDSHHNNDDVTELDVEHLISYHFVRELERRDGGVGIGEKRHDSLG